MALPGDMSKLGMNLMEQRPTKIDPEKSHLVNGFAEAGCQPQRHPLQALERSYRQRQDAANMNVLKRTQGIQAPLRLLMERKAASQVGRLPFLHSSNLMLEVLEGRDEEIGFEDILNDVSQPELMGTPHMVMERKLGLFNA